MSSTAYENMIYIMCVLLHQKNIISLGELFCFRLPLTLYSRNIYRDNVTVDCLVNRTVKFNIEGNIYPRKVERAI